MRVIAAELKKQWVEIAPLLVIKNERDYDAAVERLNALLDEVGDDENNPLYSLIDTLGIIVEAYDNENYSILNCSGVDALDYLMEEHSLSQSELPEIGSQSELPEIGSQSELPEIGSQGVVSEILNGKRKLNVRQIEALAKKIKVSPATFFD